MSSTGGGTEKSEVFHSSLSQRHRTYSNRENRSSLSMGEVEKPISDTDLLRIMECPVCNEFPAPPIYSCVKGHFTCNVCMDLLESCSLCEAPFTNVRNFALESIIESSNFKCRNAHLGCPAVVTGAELNRHVANCNFRTLDCQELDCLRINLTPAEYLEHIINQHGVTGSEKAVEGDRVVVVLNQKEDADEYRPHYVKALGSSEQKTPTFIILTKRHRTFMCWWAACLEPETFDNFTVSFSLESNSEPFAVRWTLPLQQIWKDFDEVRDTGRCAVLPDTNLLPFYIDDMSWNLKVEFVKKQTLQKEHNSKNKFALTNDHYVLLVLVVIALFAVILAIISESGLGWFYSQSGSPDFNQSLGKSDAADKQEFSEDYIGYRGFYYKA